MSIAKKKTAVEQARAALEAAERELAAEQRRRKVVEPRPGEKFYIEATFPSGLTYEYMGLRTPKGDFYITGREGKLTWDQIIDRIARADYEVYPMVITRL